MRTTVDIDAPILRQIKALQKRDGRSLGALISELLADALSHQRPARVASSFRWTSRAMDARVDLADKDAVYALLDRKDEA